MKHLRMLLLAIAIVLTTEGPNARLLAANSNSAKPAASPELVYLAARAEQMAKALPPQPAKLPAWEKRREAVRSKLPQLLGLPQREPMKAEIVKTEESVGLVVESVNYLWAESTYVSAVVMHLKAGSGRLPAIVVPPGWEMTTICDLNRDFLYHMARKGYLVLAFDDPRAGQRTAPEAGLYAVASAAGTQSMGIQIFDTLRALDYLITRADVDPGRIGVCGLCQGAEQTWLAAALEERFRVAVPVCGTTTYAEWVRMPVALGMGLSDPSPYFAGVLRDTDWDEIAACIAPRPVLIASNSGDWWWPEAGYAQLETRLRGIFDQYGAAQRFRAVRRLESHSFMPFATEITAWFDEYLKALPPSSAQPLPCGKPAEVNLSMMRYFQQRMARDADRLAAALANPKAWKAHRTETLRWLRTACGLDQLKPGQAQAVDPATREGIVTESLRLPLDAGLACPATLYRSATAARKQPGVILSHDQGECMADGGVVSLARKLAGDGFLVIVPEHVSVNGASLRRLIPGGNPDVPNRLMDYYAAGDTVGLPPLALRVWDDSRCVQYILSRSEADAKRAFVVGIGLGGLDASICAALNERIAGAACIGAITFPDWARDVASKTDVFDQLMPYLPGLLAQTDLPYLYAAVAPRPLLLVDHTDRVRWPVAGFGHATATIRSAYGLSGASSALTVCEHPSGNREEEIRSWLRTTCAQGKSP